MLCLASKPKNPSFEWAAVAGRNRSSLSYFDTCFLQPDHAVGLKGCHIPLDNSKDVDRIVDYFVCVAPRSAKTDCSAFARFRVVDHVVCSWSLERRFRTTDIASLDSSLPSRSSNKVRPIANPIGFSHEESLQV
jgi:hypothetical protein